MKHQWAMVIDMDRCTGCGACVVACAAENNTPTAGEAEAGLGRLMHWIRVSRYWSEEHGETRAIFVPTPCMQCQKAPCEIVCPVYATYHDEDDNLNAMVYNRCIGTRYCANNCPYSVRVFNWWDHRWEKPLDEQLNPDLTVRSRGVMEKCTYCIQRIRRVREAAIREGRRVRDGEVLPACAQTCPPGAIHFGDLLDPESDVSRVVGNPRLFRLMSHLGTEPSTGYLKKLRGPGR
ncbi:MAG: 4Fe-4S dicluster domain-containing protein [Verrucomicrobiota bacterium]